MIEAGPRDARGATQSSTVDDQTKPRTPVVLQVVPRLDARGGVERGTVEITRAIVDAGWGAVVASAGGVLTHQVEGAGGRHVTLPLDTKNPFRMRANIGLLAQLAKAENADIIHARSRAPAWSAWYAAQRTGCHFVTTFHGAYGAQSAFKRRYNAIMARGERVIANSHFIAEMIANGYGADRNRIRVVHRGVDRDMFSSQAVSQERVISLARRWRIPDGSPVVMLPARLTRWKGHEVLIDVLAELHRSDITVLFVGDDEGHEDYRRSLERRIERRGVSPLVHITGLCSDMPAAYMLADVVVNASTKPEAFGRVIIEALAMGRPVIAADHGGAQEIIDPGETGWLVPPGDVSALTAALNTALALGSEQRQRMAQKAIEHIGREFTLQLMCQRTLDVYREVLGQETPAMATGG